MNRQALATLVLRLADRTYEPIGLCSISNIGRTMHGVRLFDEEGNSRKERKSLLEQV
jgi:hypothetical protein